MTLSQGSIRKVRIRYHVNSSARPRKSVSGRFQVLQENSATYISIKDETGLNAALSHISHHKIIGVDTETTGLDPYTSKVRLIQIATPEKVFVIDLFEFQAFDNPSLLSLLSNPEIIKIFHHAKFDLKMLLHHFGVETRGVFDTLLASQILAAGRTNISHGLAAVSDRHLGEKVDKSAQMSDWSKVLTDEQKEYAAKDASLLLKLRDKLEHKLMEQRLLEVAKLEFECVLPVAAMELAGMAIDANCWRELLEGVKRAHEILSSELKRELAAGIPQMTLFGEPDINLDSPAQVMEALNRMGIKVEGTRSWQLQPLAKDHPAVAKLIEYRAAQKALSSYGDSLLNHIHPVTGRIHAEFRQIGATGGRMSCSDPNLQQVPNTKEYRSCFKAPSGRKLVIADYSQIELRILADWSQDTSLVRALISGEDLHVVTASQIYGMPVAKVEKEHRTAAKQLNYGMMYGLGAQGLAARIDCTVEKADELIKKYFAAYSGVAAWLKDAADRAVLDKENRTRSGRLIHFEFDPNDRSQVAATQRLGKNSPIQGSSADIIKRALTLLYDGLKPLGAKIVNCIHDEVVVEVASEQAEDCAAIVEKEMVAAGQEFIRSIPVTVDVSISDAWLK